MATGRRTLANKPHIAVIGGGAGGLELAIRLARATGRGRRARVTLIDPEPNHVWKPRLHEIAAGLLVSADEEASYAEQALRHGFAFVLGKATAVDAEQRTVEVAPVRYEERMARAHGRDLLPARTLSFNIAVLAIGSTVDDFGTPGVDEFCYTLDTADGADRLHRAILALATRVGAGEQERMRIAIVGAGTTGVELAAELRNAAGHLVGDRGLLSPDQVAITLVEMADRPLPSVAADTSDYARRVLDEHRIEMLFDAKVAEVTAGALRLADDRTVSADLVIWASGVRGRKIAVTPALKIEKGGRIRVDRTLRAVAADGRILDALYGIGDYAACFEDGAAKPVGATAQAAHQQAHLLTRSLARQLRGRAALPFRFHYRGTLVSLGAGQAVGDIPAGAKSVRLGGFTAKLAYLALYRQHLAELFGWWRTGALTLGGLLRRSAMPSFKLHW